MTALQVISRAIAIAACSAGLAAIAFSGKRADLEEIKAMPALPTREDLIAYTEGIGPNSYVAWLGIAFGLSAVYFFLIEGLAYAIRVVWLAATRRSHQGPR